MFYRFTPGYAVCYGIRYPHVHILETSLLYALPSPIDVRREGSQMLNMNQPITKDELSLFAILFVAGGNKL